ncbi:MAG: hypothetical protein WAT79_00605 [Saprospiraceae bacterium]
MKKLIIGALVGAIILFIWQFMSWAALNLHGNSTQYTSKQDTILSFLSTQLEPGFYFLPTTAPEASTEDHNKFVESASGKPWAQVYYHASFETSMSGNMIRGFVTDIVIVFLLCWLLLQVKVRSFKDTLLITIAIGLIGYLAGTYSDHIWFETPSMAHLIDAIVGFGLVGSWLGWYLKN